MRPGGRGVGWGRLGLQGTFGVRPLGTSDLFEVRTGVVGLGVVVVHFASRSLRCALGSLGSFGVIEMRPLGLLQSLVRFVLGVVGFVGVRTGGHQLISGRRVNRGAPWGLFWVAGLIVCALGVLVFFRVHSVPYDSPWDSSGVFEVAGFIGVALGFVRFVRDRWVVWGAPLGRRDLSGPLG